MSILFAELFLEDAGFLKSGKDYIFYYISHPEVFLSFMVVGKDINSSSLTDNVIIQWNTDNF